MENKKLSYWNWLQKDNIFAIVMLGFLSEMFIRFAPQGDYSWICYTVAIILATAACVVIIKSCILDWIKYKKSND